MISELTIAKQQQDFVDIINSSMKMSPWCSETAKKACKFLGANRDGRENRIRKVIMPQDKSLLHLHPEHCVRIWSLVSNMTKWNWKEMENSQDDQRHGAAPI